MPLVRLLLMFLVLSLSAAAQRLSALAGVPDWSRLEACQETMTREEFARLLDTVYAPRGAAAGVIEVRETDALIHTTLTPPATFTLRFAKDAVNVKAAPTYWRAHGASSEKQPLAGLRLVLDPGHLGGKWGAMEERSFAKPGEPPVQEGDMTLLVAQHVAEMARALGAEVQLVRSQNEPVSPATVEELRAPARKELELLGTVDIRENYDGPRDPLKAQTVQAEAEKLFYRVAEIRERARLVNTKMRPDLVVCLHFNAAEWSDPTAPVFTAINDLHVLVHGCYSATELRYDDQRLEMLVKLLHRTHAAELAAAQPVAEALANATGLPPFLYATGNAVRVSTSDFLWARNLLANRLYECPVVFLEPYRMNSEEGYARMQAGDYEGAREIAGKPRQSIFREYASGVVAGLVAWWRR